MDHKDLEPMAMVDDPLAEPLPQTVVAPPAPTPAPVNRTFYVSNDHVYLANLAIPFTHHIHFTILSIMSSLNFHTWPQNLSAPLLLLSSRSTTFSPSSLPLVPPFFPSSCSHSLLLPPLHTTSRIFHHAFAFPLAQPGPISPKSSQRPPSSNLPVLPRSTRLLGLLTTSHGPHTARYSSSCTPHTLRASFSPPTRAQAMFGCSTLYSILGISPFLCTSFQFWTCSELTPLLASCLVSG